MEKSSFTYYFLKKISTFEAVLILAVCIEIKITAKSTTTKPDIVETHHTAK